MMIALALVLAVIVLLVAADNYRVNRMIARMMEQTMHIPPEESRGTAKVYSPYKPKGDGGDDA